MLIDNGEVFLWGCGQDGQLGLGNINNYYSPQLVTFYSNQNGKALNINSVEIECGHNITGVISGKFIIKLYKITFNR